MLKKQTVWLLTMLSLMIVLSVYYIMSPDRGDLAYVDTGSDESEETASDTTNVDGTNENTANEDGSTEVDDITNTGQDELFATIRLKLQDERSMEKSRLKETLASSTATTEEKNSAKTGINNIDELETKELILEKTIMADSDYHDVLVRHDEDKIHVHVKVDELSNKEVVNIMQMVRDEFGEIRVNVNLQPTAK